MSRTREKDTVEDHRRLDIRALHRAKVLQTRHQTSWHWSRDDRMIASIGLQVESQQRLHLRYQLTRHGQPEQLDYPVRITWTACHLGGQRPWFLCPCCGKRVAILYLKRIFACRQCLRLNYTSQQSSRYNLACDQSWKLRRALGCQRGVLDLSAEFIPRPKGMHQRTFARKIARLQQLDEQALDGIGVMLAQLDKTLGRVQRRMRR